MRHHCIWKPLSPSNKRTMYVGILFLAGATTGTLSAIFTASDEQRKTKIIFGSVRTLRLSSRNSYF